MILHQSSVLAAQRDFLYKQTSYSYYTFALFAETPNRCQQDARNRLPRLVIRADAGPAIGHGHVVRCMALAHAWIERLGEVVLVTHDLPAGLRRSVADIGVRIVPLPLGHAFRDDIAETGGLLRAVPGSLLVLDGNQFDDDYRRAVSADAAGLIVIDDNAGDLHYTADILVNPNIYAPSLKYRTLPGTLECCGTDFALLRPQFLLQQRDTTPKDTILVTIGGSDPKQVTLRTINALLERLPPTASVVAVLSADNPQMPVLLEKSDRRLRVVTGVDGAAMATLMSESVIAVSAVGGTALELAHMGVAMVLITVVDNQRRAAQSFAEQGAAIHLGWHADVRGEATADAVLSLLNEPKRLESMVARGRSLVDGLGTGRVIAAAMELVQSKEGVPKRRPG